MNLLRQLSDYRQFLREFILQLFRTRYRGSIVGFGWTLLVPFVTLTTLAFIFSQVNHADMKNYFPFFLAGYVAWMLFSSAMNNAIPSVVGNPHFVSRIYAPKVVFPVAGFVVAMVEFAAFFVSALLILAFFGLDFKATMLFLPVSVAVLSVFALGASLLAATANVYFRDVNFLWGATSSLLFFCTPILYPIGAISPGIRPIFEANPLYPLVRLFQDPMTGHMPPADMVTTAVLYAAIMLIIGATVFSRSEKSFYQYL